VRQTVQGLSSACKELEAAVISGRLHHNSPVLSWCISNLQTKVDANGNLFPNKAAAKNKIDAASAMINALARAMQVSAGHQSWVDSLVGVSDEEEVKEI
jgi:phage terminase large subunit-like protein